MTSETATLVFLKKVSTFSILERGMNAVTEGKVLEFHKTGENIPCKLNGLVKDDETNTHSVNLEIISAEQIIAKCSCDPDLDEQWCHHAVALLWNARDLGFLERDSGFDSGESSFRMNISTPQEIAAVIHEINHSNLIPNKASDYKPKVNIGLELSSDRLGVQVTFDGEAQVPSFLENLTKRSSRSLDNILLKILDEDGVWDEANKLWFISQSNSIEKVLGLIQEYTNVKTLGEKQAVIFEKELLEAKLLIEWQDTSVEMMINWVLPDGTLQAKSSELIGTGPYWVCIGQNLYRLSSLAARIARLFPHSPSLVYSKTQSGPVLEALGQFYNNKYINIVNPELQPTSEIKQPAPRLELSIPTTPPEVLNPALEIIANLYFDYPASSIEQNVVYLPDREKEKEHKDLLLSLGFKEQDQIRSRYIIANDHALDFINNKNIFSKDWDISGLDQVKKRVKFATLSLNVSLAEVGGDKKATHENSSFSEWFDCHVSLVQNNANVPISLLFKNATQASDKWVLLDSGAYAKVPGGGLNQLKATLGILDPNYRLSNNIKRKISSAQALSLTRHEDQDFILNLDKKLKAFVDRLSNYDSINKLEPSKKFQGTLRSYQKDGLSWLAFLRDFGLCGILADEMGLGKTIQTLALIQHLKENKITGPTLIVAPTSVITNWSYEAKKFTPNLSVLLLHGPQRKQLFSKIKDADIVLTTYALLRIDGQELERFKFNYVVLDEAQNIKNPSAATTKAAKSLRCNHRLCLTGTPTENRPLELWSIIDFLMPGYLGSNEYFKKHIEKPILEGGPGVEIARFLNARTKPFILRRTKAQVEKDLPPKIESELHVEMAPSQAIIYSQILEEVRPKVFEAVKEKGVRGASISILSALLRLRQICNHPNSIEYLKEAEGFESGKFNLLQDLLEEALEEGKKILLFAQFIEMLAIIRRWLDSKGINYVYMDGSTKNRQNIVDNFNNDDKVRLFLISLKTGGTGLNLTAADTVVIYDPWWNPAVEDQATDRAHRIGQTKTVNVYRLVTENSVEQRIMGLKAKKAKMVDALINNNGLSTINLSKADIEGLFAPIGETQE